jgi:uroporphyrinogen-III synthase
MLVTRPQPEAEETAGRLAALDIEAEVLSLLERVTLTGSLPDPEGFAAMALSSANALAALADRGMIETYRGLRVFAVGDRTAQSAEKHGFTNVVSAHGAFGDLAELLIHAGLKGPVFYPAARDQSGDLAKSLAPHGVMVVTARVYEMNEAAAFDEAICGRLARGEFGAALFYSRRTAEVFIKRVAPKLGRGVATRLGVLCLSETIAEPVVAARFVRVGLADYPSEDAMMGLCLSFARDQNPS